MKLASDGTPWAVGHSARLLKRKNAVWTRVQLDETKSNLVAVSVHDRLVSVVAEDGTVLEGRAD